MIGTPLTEHPVASEERWIVWINGQPHLVPSRLLRVPTLNDVKTLKEDFWKDAPIDAMDDIVASKTTVHIIKRRGEEV